MIKHNKTMAMFMAHTVCVFRNGYAFLVRYPRPAIGPHWDDITEPDKDRNQHDDISMENVQEEEFYAIAEKIPFHVSHRWYLLGTYLNAPNSFRQTCTIKRNVVSVFTDIIVI